MTNSAEITTDAGLSEVMGVITALEWTTQPVADAERNCYRLGTTAGAYITVAEDLKISEDVLETCVDVYEQTDGTAQRRLFDALAKALSARVTMFAEASDEIIAQANV